MELVRKYYSVLELFDGKWSVQFGDYCKDVALDEMENMRDFGSKLKLICTADTQSSVDAKVMELNSK